MTVAQMRYFSEICRQGNITRAAESLHIAQPSLSIAIKNLEKQVGCELFFRRYGRLVLTQEGEYFQHKCNEILRMIDDLNLDMLDRSSYKKTLRIGASTFAAYKYRQPLIEFMQRNPNVQVEAFEFDSAETEKMLLDDELDVGIGTVTEMMYSKFDIIDLECAPVVFCVRGRHPLAGLPVVRAADLDNQPIVMARSDSVHAGSLIMEGFAQAGVAPRIVLRTSQFATSSQYVLDFDVGSFEFEEFAKSVPGIVRIPLDPPIVLKIGLFWRKGASLRSSATRFLKYMAKN